MLAEAPPDIKGVAQTPAEHLFKVNPVLFLNKWAHPDILMMVAFLATWVQAHDWDDYKKLAKVLNYLCTTCDLVLTLEASNAGVAEWWINGAFGNHSNMWSHSGECLSLGRGMVTSKSLQQNLNTRSSTEAELVTVDDCDMILPVISLFLLRSNNSMIRTSQ